MTGTTSVYHYDGQGSTQMLTDKNGNITDRYCNTAFGEPVNTGAANPTVNPFRYNGQFGYYYDADPGEYYVRARTYSPVQARWLSVDPIGCIIGNAGRLTSDASGYQVRINLYEYGSNNPLTLIDPTGEIEITLRVWGNYCGPGWCGGKYQRESACGSSFSVPATDQMDACCKAHDACIGGWNASTGKPLPPGSVKTEKQCDKDMCKCLTGMYCDLPDVIEKHPGVRPIAVEKLFTVMFNLFCYGGLH